MECKSTWGLAVSFEDKSLFFAMSGITIGWSNAKVTWALWEISERAIFGGSSNFFSCCDFKKSAMLVIFLSDDDPPYYLNNNAFKLSGKPETWSDNFLAAAAFEAWAFNASASFFVFGFFFFSSVFFFSTFFSPFFSLKKPPVDFPF